MAGREPKGVALFLGKVHPNLIDPEFYRSELGEDCIFASVPYDMGALSAFAMGEKFNQPQLKGGELLCVARL